MNRTTIKDFVADLPWHISARMNLGEKVTSMLKTYDFYRVKTDVSKLWGIYNEHSKQDSEGDLEKDIKIVKRIHDRSIQKNKSRPYDTDYFHPYLTSNWMLRELTKIYEQRTIQN